MATFKLEYILWVDTHSQDEWTYEIDCTVCHVETIGFVVKETEDCISVTHTRTREEDVTHCCIIHIPKVCIKQRLPLTAVVD